MIFAVEAWTIPESEEPEIGNMVMSKEFDDQGEAQQWAWERMEEGYSVNMWRRQS